MKVQNNEKEVKKYKSNETKLFSNIMIIIFTITFIISAYKIIEWIKDNNKNDKITKKLSETVHVIKDNEFEENSDINTYVVDFKTLKEQNADIVGWLKINGTNIEYPVVKTKDNSFYLKHSFDKSYNVAGWIFVDYRNKCDGTDKNIVIYGHNMKAETMFGSLKKLLTEEWYGNEKNRDIIFITENEYSIYEVFSVYEIPDENYYLTIDFKNNEFGEFLEKIRSRSKKNFNVNITNNDEILTLSTCGNNNKYRTVVHAKKVNKFHL